MTNGGFDLVELTRVDRPTDPLRVLGEYLIMRSKELENLA